MASSHQQHRCKFQPDHPSWSLKFTNRYDSLEVCKQLSRISSWASCFCLSFFCLAKFDEGVGASNLDQVPRSVYAEWTTLNLLLKQEKRWHAISTTPNNSVMFVVQVTSPLQAIGPAPKQCLHPANRQMDVRPYLKYPW